jgi:nicotinamide-nucleotide amidase
MVKWNRREEQPPPAINDFKEPYVTNDIIDLAAQGVIAYSNASKTELLDVSAALIAQLGTVSEEVAAAMAKGALANSNAHVALSTTGIAGPTGAVPGKPVGTVCFGWTRGEATYTERLVFAGDRQSVREQTVVHALKGLLRFVE